MILGKPDAAAAGRRRGPHGQALGLDELDGRVPTTGGVDVRAGHEDRPLGGAQTLGQRGDLLGGGLRAAADAARDLRGVVDWRDLDQPVVHRDRHERRAGGRQRRVVDRLRERKRDVRGPWRLVAVLDVWLGHLDGVAVGQVRLHGDQRARLLAGGHEQRSAVGARVEDRADTVADSRSGVQVDVRDVAARLREPVGHAHRDGLLQPEHVAEVVRERTEHRQLGRPGIAEDRRHPVPAKQLEGSVAHARHVISRPSSSAKATRVAAHGTRRSARTAAAPAGATPRAPRTSSRGTRRSPRSRPRARSRTA